MSFANLKSSRSSSIDKLVQAAEAVSTKAETKSYADDRFWKPTQDKAGNGYAVIRFLPAKEGEDLPWVRYWDHGFKGPNGLWYIENSLTSVNQPDPVSEMNSELWNTGRDEDKQLARERKRRLHHVSNIMVISDSANPENEGRVFLYKFGKKIFDKVMDIMQPQFADEDPINPFDFWEGANFKLKIRKVDGYWNYDKSEFDSPTPIKENDEAIEQVWDKQYALKPFLAPENFKSYDELKAKLDKVLLGTRSTGTAEDVTIPPVTNVAPVKTETVDNTSSTPITDEDSDETLSYFSKLAEEE
jgi:hypothetical protein